jgi:hypothetical protein
MLEHGRGNGKSVPPRHATLVLLLNGTYPQLLTQNTADGGVDFFTIGNPATIVTLPVGVSYAVTVGTQPSGQTCVVANGSGISALDNPVVAVTCANSSSNGMSSSLRQASSATSDSGPPLPSARQGAASWSDAAANLWLFGGQSTDPAGAVHMYGDLWKYQSSNRAWCLDPDHRRGPAGALGTHVRRFMAGLVRQSLAVRRLR